MSLKPYYQDSAVTLYLGDCREIVPTLGRFDLLLTDPPYGIGALMKGGKNTGHWNQLSSGNDWDMEIPDMAIHIAAADVQIIWGGNYFPLPPARCMLVWRKLNAVPTQAGCELAWTNISFPAQVFSSVSGGAMERHGHPTEKPLELMNWCLGFAPDAQTVIDPFAGSGTTGRACKDLGRKCVMVEREERYCEIAARRMGQEVLNLQ